MGLKQIIYSSEPFGYDDSTLISILFDARRCNARDDITGALVCRQDIFLQLLEGPEDKVDATLRRIGLDDRHMDMTLHHAAPASRRLFAGWAMLHDPARSWIWSQAEIAGGKMTTATTAEILSVFTRLAADAPVD